MSTPENNDNAAAAGKCPFPHGATEEKSPSASGAEAGKCPFHHGASEEKSVLARGAGSGTSNRDWWPNMLRVDLLNPVSYTHLTLPTIHGSCRSRWSPYH